MKNGNHGGGLTGKRKGANFGDFAGGDLDVGRVEVMIPLPET